MFFTMGRGKTKATAVSLTGGFHAVGIGQRRTPPAAIPDGSHGHLMGQAHILPQAYAARLQVADIFFHSVVQSKATVCARTKESLMAHAGCEVKTGEFVAVVSSRAGGTMKLTNTIHYRGEDLTACLRAANEHLARRLGHQPRDQLTVKGFGDAFHKFRLAAEEGPL